MRSWLVVGGGGHARAVLDVILRRGDAVAGWVLLPGETAPSTGETFSDDAAALAAARARGWSVTFAVGSNRVRAKLLAGYTGLLPDQLAPLVAASATVSHGATVGPGTQILEHAHVGPGAQIGAAVIVNTAANVEHDAVVGDTAHIAPGAHLLGAAELGAESMLGSGARVLPERRVGSGITVGAGAVVTTDLTLPGTYVGQPARPTRRQEQP